MASPRKISTISNKKLSYAVSPAHASYRAPLYNIQLDESDKSDMRKQKSARTGQNNSQHRQSMNTSYLRDGS